jgi:hypothetical protein
VEKLLLIWINEKMLAGDSVSEGIVCEKARRLHEDLVETPGRQLSDVFMEGDSPSKQ